MIFKTFKTYQKILKNFRKSFFNFGLILLFFVFGVFPSMANAQNSPKVWNDSNSELRISSPLITEIESEQGFYLRYTQNITSFDLTKSIDWQIKDSNKNVVYSRHLDSNLDKSEAVNIVKPGLYSIDLSLKIDTSVVNTTRKIKIIPKDAAYYFGLRFNEFDLQNSQIELFNDSDTDIDSSSLIVDYNENEKFSLSGLSTIPAKSYTVISLKSKLKSDSKVNLVFEKSSKQKTEQIIDTIDSSNLYTSETDSKTLQFDAQTKLWKWSNSTLGQPNTFEIKEDVSANSNSSIVQANFQKNVTHRTGGFDNGIFTIIPFLIVFIAYITTLLFDRKEDGLQIGFISNNAKHLIFRLFRFLTSFKMAIINCLSVIIGNLNNFSFAKIKVCLQNCITWLEVFSLRAILHLQTL